MNRTNIIEEAKYHNSPIMCVQYSPNGKYLITSDQQGNYNLFDVSLNFQPIKVFEGK